MKERSEISRVPFDPSQPTAEERLLSAIFNVPLRTPEARLRDHQLALERRRVFLSQEFGRPIEEIPSEEADVEQLYQNYQKDQTRKLVESFFEGLTPQERSVFSQLRGLDTGKPRSQRKISKETGLSLKEIRRIENEAQAKVKANSDRIDNDLKRELKDDYDVDYPLFEDEEKGF